MVFLERFHELSPKGEKCGTTQSSLAGPKRLFWKLWCPGASHRLGSKISGPVLLSFDRCCNHKVGDWLDAWNLNLFPKKKHESFFGELFWLKISKLATADERELHFRKSHFYGHTSRKKVSTWPSQAWHVWSQEKPHKALVMAKEVPGSWWMV